MRKARIGVETFPFRGKYKPEVIVASNIRKKLRNRVCTVIRSNKAGDKYVLCWDGTKTNQQVPKRFIAKLRDKRVIRS